jgi:phage protein D
MPPDVSGITLTLLIGPMIPLPAQRPVMEALQHVEVSHSDSGPSAFQLTFHADRAARYSDDYGLLVGRTLAPGSRVVLSVKVGEQQTTLMDGFITRQELTHDREAGASIIAVTGEDVSVQMDMTEDAFEWPSFSHAEIVESILAKYAMYGITPTVIPPLTDLVTDPLEHVPQQNATDRAYINYLAGLYGYVFFVHPGAVPMTNVAYWGPPPRIGTVQEALSVDMGPATNVERISMQYDGLAATRYTGLTQDHETESQLPVLTFASTRTPPLARDEPLVTNPAFIRTRRYDDPRFDAEQALAYAQGLTDVSTDRVVTVQGELDTLRYGAVLSAPGLVGLRGCGVTYDGVYYVQAVTHTIRRGAYRQGFRLAREGVVATVSRVVP